MSHKKIGTDLAKGWINLGGVELRNFATLQPTDVGEDIRWSMNDVRRGQHYGQGQEQTQQHEQLQER